ncbi:hypothetical protein EBB07_29135 [Paenibacillaceae bacterium]|nr:hypothetical protein EBB07_29135 [Paenibacillaceae bacterium]
MFIIVQESQNPVTKEFELDYLGWQPPAWDEDGYFWTSKDVIGEILSLGYNTSEHPFLFNTKEEALERLRKLRMTTKCRIVNY